MTDHLHPFTILLLFLFAIFVPSFSGNFIVYLASIIVGFIVLLSYSSFIKALHSIRFFIIIFILVALANPLFYHDGNTVIFYINSKRITLEALYYGISSGLMILAILIWCLSLTHFMTDDKVQYLFGLISPKTALIVSMILRFVPFYSKQFKSYRHCQKALGLYGSNTFLEKIKSEILIMGGFLSRLLEHSMTTSDSISSRGYGLSKRKPYKLYSFKNIDLLICICLTFAASLMIYEIAIGSFEINFYPSFTGLNLSWHCTLTLVIFSLVELLPAILQATYNIKSYCSQKQSI